MLYILLTQQTIISTIKRFLRKHNINLKEFDEQAKTIINNAFNYYNSNFGDIKNSSAAFGDSASASNEGRKPGGDDPNSK